MLSGNALKLIAAAAMLLDHAGLLLFPQIPLLRVLGRLAFPIYAFMIAEGCKYTRNRKRYFLGIFLLGIFCQAIYFLADGSLYLSVLITFCLAILMLYALSEAKKNPTPGTLLRLGLTILAVWGLNQVFAIDYGFWGCMLPVFAGALQGTSWESRTGNLLSLTLGLVLLSAALGGIQWYCLLALPLLALYSGRRGKGDLKYFFYIFYPVHLGLLQVLAWCIA